MNELHSSLESAVGDRCPKFGRELRQILSYRVGQRGWKKSLSFFEPIFFHTQRRREFESIYVRSFHETYSYSNLVGGLGSFLAASKPICGIKYVFICRSFSKFAIFAHFCTALKTKFAELCIQNSVQTPESLQNGFWFSKSRHLSSRCSQNSVEIAGSSGYLPEVIDVFTKNSW